MAVYPVPTFTPSLPLSLLDGLNNSGYISCSDATWSTARNPPPGTIGTSTQIRAGASESGGTYFIYRAFLQFQIPSNLDRLDQPPELKIRANAINGDGKIAITSIDYTYFETPWSDWTPVRAFGSAQYGDPATMVYYATSGAPYYTFSDTTGYTTIPLTNGDVAASYDLAKYHCLTKPYVTICLMGYTNDFEDAAPASSTSITTVFDDPGDAYPPQLVLQKPWFVDNRGTQPKYTQPTYVINPYAVGVNQHPRSVAQLPFSTAIKGPISLRGKNVPYKVTT